MRCPGLPAGDVAEQVRDHALRQVVGLDLVRRPRAAAASAPGPSGRRSTRLTSPAWARWFRPRVLAVALAGGIDQGQVARPAPAVVLREMQRLERDRDLLGEADADEAAGRDRVAVADQRTASAALTILPSFTSLARRRQHRAAALAEADAAEARRARSSRAG